MTYRRLMGIGAGIGAMAFIGLTASAAAQDYDYYVSGTLGINNQQNSDNSGDFTDPFTVSGTGTALDGATLPEGTELGWETDFNDGYTLGVAAGRDYGALRFDIELAFAKNDVEAHRMVDVAGMSIDAVDAAVLVESQTTPFGINTATIVADGQGDIRTTYLLANAYYDFENTTRLTPYVGGGIGAGFVNVDYSPSDIGIVDDSATAFAYQIVGGLDYAINDTSSVLTNIRYRGTTDVEVDVDLFPAQLDIENSSYVLEAGYRHTF